MSTKRLWMTAIFFFSLLICPAVGVAAKSNKGEGKRQHTAQRKNEKGGADTKEKMKQKAPKGEASDAHDDGKGKSGGEGHRAKHGKMSGDTDSAGKMEGMHKKGHPHGKMNDDMDSGSDHGKGHAFGKDKEQGEGLKRGHFKDRQKRIKAMRETHQKKKQMVDAAKKKKGKKADETKKHLRRMSRLKRLMEVAEQNGNAEMKDKVAALMEKEQARHQKSLARMQK
ncbi:MAG: hypothetical protein JXR76_01320 [Deltaproteobacteria bacterium]|nr:hypothetical protein [Deltaproteobacteria bacterium]